MLPEHDCPACHLLILRDSKLASIVSKGTSALGDSLWEEPCWNEVAIINAVIWTICKYVLLRGVPVEVDEDYRLYLAC